MDVLVGFGIFLVAIVVCMVWGLSLAWALLVGFFCFLTVGLRRGYGLGQLLTMAGRGACSALVVQRIMLLIGLLTALWRASGTIAFFVHTGIGLITHQSFIFVAFLLPAVLSLSFGSSYGVSGTAGVILMVIARSGGANLAVTAGAILSGAYVGERLSPASSAAALTAAVSGTGQRGFQKRMWRTTPLPLALSLMIYGGLSLTFPIQSVDGSVLEALVKESNLDWPVLLPAVVLLVLPWFHVSAFYSILTSCFVATGVALFCQDIPVMELGRDCLLGYQAHELELREILSGGGLISMVSPVIIIFLSCANSGLFSGTGILDPYKQKVDRLVKRIGHFPSQMVVALACACLFCNQAVSIVMSAELLRREYPEDQAGKLDLAAGIGDSAINLAALVPWCIASSVPLATIGGSMAALPFAVYLYLVPLCRWGMLQMGRRNNLNNL
jgi:NhaC family Na+:H+ antiporter